jgi:signal transduction histidine kinase
MTAGRLDPPGGEGMSWRTLLGMQGAVFGLIGTVLAVIWAAAGGGDFWPRWVWLGFALVVGAQAAVRQALATRPGRWRFLHVHTAVAAVVIALQIAIWLLSGLGTFWPIWPILGFTITVGLNALVVTRLLAPAHERELAERVDVLTRTRRGALDVQAAELRRIERDLHDGAQARLVSLAMQLGRAEERLGDRPEVAEIVRLARGEAGAAIAELRDLARGIAPPVLADRGLEAAVDALGRRAAIPVTVDARLDRRLLPVIETAAYFLVAEALTNVAKHGGGAGAHLTVALEGDWLRVEVTDSGPGGADPGGSGLTGLRHRVEALDGTLTVSSPPGGGTTIRGELPCAP